MDCFWHQARRGKRIFSLVKIEFTKTFSVRITHSSSKDYMVCTLHQPKFENRTAFENLSIHLMNLLNFRFNSFFF